MEKGTEVAKIFAGFSKLHRADRLARLLEIGALTSADVAFLNSGGLENADLAEKFIENVIGYFQIPLGVATNFRIDGTDYVIPMAVEETSIVAAASKTAKWIRETGEIKTESLGNLIIGQIQLANVRSFGLVREKIISHKKQLINQANAIVASGLVRRGGGVQDLVVRQVPRGDGNDMAVIHVLADPCDSMGANTINQVCEFLKKPIEDLTDEKVSLCILSNLVDTRLTRVTIIIRNINPELGHRIEEASLFALRDPYRAATNNKGVLNGIDAVLVATGNDWRAVEAGVHAYAARSGQYRSITEWKMQGCDLIGILEAPVVVATAGGVTQAHPTAKMCLEMIGLKKSMDLSRVIAAVGLVQNLGALRALTTEGIIEGHMKLHIKNLIIHAGATDYEAPILQGKLEEILALTKRITLSTVIEVLNEIRGIKEDLEDLIEPLNPLKKSKNQ
ncbi:MAG: hydroxymethylglutaryl-CoA reductase, degradative [Pseudomonadota bacterium]|nr:hydroxymethylglutaryl-CoA reductase, degradative [Pseudomonadota bacterium]